MSATLKSGAEKRRRVSPDDLPNVKLDIENVTRMKIPEFANQPAHTLGFPARWLSSRPGDVVFRFPVPFPDSDTLVVARTHDITGSGIETESPNEQGVSCERV